MLAIIAVAAVLVVVIGVVAAIGRGRNSAMLNARLNMFCRR